MSLLGLSSSGHFGDEGSKEVIIYRTPLSGVIKDTVLEGKIVSDELIGVIEC